MHTHHRLGRAAAAGALCGVGCAVAHAQWLPAGEILAPDGNAYAQFGEPIVLRGGRALIGDSWADNQGMRSGAAHLFDVTNPAGAVRLAEILPSDGGQEYHFGYALDYDGSVALIGCLWHGEHGFQAGAAYLFDVSTPNAPVQLARFSGQDTGAGDNFSRSVALSGRVALVGSPGTGDTGFAYAFDVSDPANPVEVSRFTAGDAAMWDDFGWSAAMHGALALIGSTGDDSMGQSAGAAYLFDMSDPAGPVQLAKLIDPEGSAGDRFGVSVALSGDRAIVGARHADSGAGSASLYDLTDPRNPVRVARLLPFGGGSFGAAVALSQRLALVGCPYCDDDLGAAFVFDASTGFGAGRLGAGSGGSGDRFGSAVAIGDDLALVASPFDGFGAVSAFIPCAVNFNGDERVDTRDVLDFLIAWTAERTYNCALVHCSSDFSGDGRIDTQDVAAFLSAWGAGCR